MKILDIPRSGSYAGITSGHNRAGQYVRNRRAPTNSPTPRRTAQRGAMAGASSAFADLTATQQASWAAFADGHPVTDKLGQSIKLTGHQWYVSTGATLFQFGGDYPTDPPLTAAVFSASGATGTFTLVAGIHIDLSATGGADDILGVSLSTPLSSGRTFCNKFRQYVLQSGDSATFTLTTATYSAAFGTPVVGQKVFVKLTPYNQYGVKGVPVVLVLTVDAG
jgi:hypothetical protein